MGLPLQTIALHSTHNSCQEKGIEGQDGDDDRKASSYTSGGAHVSEQYQTSCHPSTGGAGGSRRGTRHAQQRPQVWLQ